MSGKPTYEELEQRLKELEKEALEHNRTEKALGVAEHKLRELYRTIEQSSEGIATASLDGNFVFTNPTWTEMHGYQPDELVGQPVDILDSPEDREKLPAVWQEIKKKGFWRGEIQRVRKNGSSFPAIMTSSLVRDDKDTPLVIIGTCQDITERKLAEDELKRAHDELERQVEERTAELVVTNEQLKMEIEERKQAEKALRESEERYRSLAENSMVGFWQITLEGYTTYINPAMCSMIEIEGPEALSGQTYHSFFTPKSLETIDRERDRRLEGEGSCYEVEIVGKRGGRRYVVICGASLLSAEGKFRAPDIGRINN